MCHDFLSNAVALLNKIWLVYREEICADQVDQIIWKSPRRLVLRSGCLERTTKKRPGTFSPLMKFPDYLCRTPRDKTILLNFLQCNVAVTHMQCILEWLLKDIRATVEVAMFLLKDPPLIVTLEPDGSPPISNLGYRHVCWRITLTSGEMYAVDLTGAQYGWFDLVCPWQECFETRCLGEESLYIGSQNADQLAPLMAAESGALRCAPPKVDNYYVSVQKHFSRSLQPHLSKFQAVDILKASEADKTETERELLNEVRRQAELATLAADKIWNTFPWSSIWEEKCHLAEKQRCSFMYGAFESLHA